MEVGWGQPDPIVGKRPTGAVIGGICVAIAGDIGETATEEVGFEPTESLHPRWFSRPVP